MLSSSAMVLTMGLLFVLLIWLGLFIVGLNIDNLDNIMFIQRCGDCLLSHGQTPSGLTTKSILKN